MNTPALTNELSLKIPAGRTPGAAPAAASETGTPGVPENPPTADPGATRRRRASRIAFIVTGLVVGGAGLWFFVTTHGRQSTDSAFIDGHRVAVAAQVSGRVSELLIDDNQHVDAGQLLLRIDPADYQVKLDQAEAAHAQAEGALAHARAQLPVIEAAARQASAQVKVAKANARKTADDLGRYRQLSADAVSRIVLDAAQTQADVSSAQVDAARQAATGAEAQIALARTAVTTAEANVRATEAQIAQAKLNLSYCELRAPVAGFVTRRTVERGNFIQVGQPLLNLVSDDFFVTANFKETQLTHMRAGQVATITVDTLPGVIFRGHVESRMAGTGSAFALLPPENASGNFVKVVQRVPVKIVFDRLDPVRLSQLALGMSVIATVDVRPSAPVAAPTATVNQ